MAWRPWYERMAEIDSAEERADFIRGVFGPPSPSTSKKAGMALTALLAGWGVRQLKSQKKK